MPSGSAWLVFFRRTERTDTLTRSIVSTNAMQNLWGPVEFFMYLQALFINLFLILGIWTMFRPGMIFGDIGDWLSERYKYRPWIVKPLYDCVPCMSSVWGSIFYWFSRLHEQNGFWFWPVHVICLCGLGSLAMMLEKSNE